MKFIGCLIAGVAVAASGDLSSALSAQIADD